MRKDKNCYLAFTLASIVSLTITGCGGSDSDSSENNVPTETVTRYFTGIEFGTDPTVEVLSDASNLEAGTISPINNGIVQPAWMAYIQGEDQIITIGYNTAPELTSYELVNGELEKGDSFFVANDIYAASIVDESTMVMISSPRAGLADKVLSIVDTDEMEVIDSVFTNFGNVDVDGDGIGNVEDENGDPVSDGDENDLLAFPTDMHVRGDTLFISYYLIHSSGDFSTPDANEAHVAVFTYPELEFVKVISDDRASNISRYYAFNGLLEDENGDIYTFSPSSLASGYSPVPENNSAILRIRNGETEFDPDFHIDFESISGGLKINDMFYTQNGKAVVRATTEEENNDDYLWVNYSPTSSNPLISTGIIDLVEGTYTALTEVPMIGGGWNSPYMVEGSNVYLGVSNATYAGIYVIDTEAGTATEGALIDGNYAKSILSLTDEVEVE